MKKIILIDGNSLMFRSYYATAYTGNLMQNKQGLYTNALFGFCNMINKLLEEEYDAIFVAFDAGKKTFRHLQYADYKGGRKPMPEEFKMQIPYIKEYLDLLNIKRYETLDYEADDLIATIATLAQDDYDVKVITGDKDLLQLVSSNIKVFITRKGVGELEEYNVDNFYEKMGIKPLQLTDYKGLIGDSSDNLSGIKGIGPKSACDLLNKYDTLENIIAHVDELKGKQALLIKEGANVGLTCKKLATLVRNIDLEFNLNDLNKKEYNVSNLISFYEKVEFNSFIRKLKQDSNAPSNETKYHHANYELVNKDTSFNNIENCYLDLEIFGESYYKASVLGLAIICNDHNYFYDFKEKNDSLEKMLENENVGKITFDFKKLYVCLKQKGIIVKGLKYDLLLASYLVNPSFANDDLKKVADNFTSNDLEFDEVIYGYKSKAKVPEEDIYASHAINKALFMKDFIKIIDEKIKAFDQENLLKVEQDLATVLGDMELSGLKVDIKRLKEIGEELEIKAKDIIKEIYDMAGEEFNINSVKQLGYILFEKLALPHGKKNKTGYATGSEVLEKLAVNYPIAQKILDYRAINKLSTTYINGMFELIDDGFIHPLYKQALTLTGRLSSVNPNIQNMPIRTDLGRVIRDCFVSRYEGGKIFSSDYSQIELRVLAHMANDANMLNLFASNVDFHTSTAAQIYEVKESEVTPAMRRSAKAINFGIVYGMSSWGLSETLGISPIEANIYINKYFYRFSNVKTFLDNTVENAKKDGYTKTIMNRIRYIPELSSSNKALASFGERTAMNSPIQGSAADIIKIAMVNVAKKIKGKKSLLIAQVHDELVFDVYPGEEESLMKMVKEEMENAVKLRVKLIAEGEIGHSWLKD